MMKPLYRFVERRLDITRCHELIDKRNEAIAAQEPVVSVYFPNGENSRTFYLSVFTGKKESYARLKRTIIAIDTLKDTWTGACEQHKLRRGCGHKALAKLAAT